MPTVKDSRVLRMIAYVFFATLCICGSTMGGSDSLKAQNRVLLFYMENEEYLLPFIEQTLSELSHADYSGSLFTEVLNLNAFEDDIRYQTTVRSLIDYYGGKSSVLELPDEARNAHDAIAQGLSEYHLFLKIRVHVLNELLEYQFMLYETIPALEAGRDFPVQDVKRSHRARTVFINPKQPDYLVELKNTIKQVFPASNQPPVPVVKVNGRLNEGTEVHRFAAGDTVVLDASESIDRDSPRSSFAFAWRQIDRQGRVNVPLEELLPIDSGAARQVICPNRLGFYVVGVFIGDGIEPSPEETIMLEIVDRPALRISTRELRSVSQGNLVSLFNRTVRNQFFMYGSIDVELVGFHSSEFALEVESIDRKFDNSTPELDHGPPVADPPTLVESTSPPLGEDDSQSRVASPSFKVRFLDGTEFRNQRFMFSSSSAGGKYSCSVAMWTPSGDYRFAIHALQDGVRSSSVPFVIHQISRSPVQAGCRVGSYDITGTDWRSSDGPAKEREAMWSWYVRLFVWNQMAFEFARLSYFHPNHSQLLGGSPIMFKVQMSLWPMNKRYHFLPAVTLVRHQPYRFSEPGESLIGGGFDAEFLLSSTLSIEYGFYLLAGVGGSSSRSELLSIGITYDPIR